MIFMSYHNALSENDAEEVVHQSIVLRKSG